MSCNWTLITTCPVQCINTYSMFHNHKTPLKATLFSRVSHNVELVTDAAALQQRGKHNNMRWKIKGVLTQGLITDASNGGSQKLLPHTNKASKLESRQGKIKDKNMFFTFLGDRGIKECWIYLSLQARISTSFPRTWKLNQTLLR